MEFVTPKYEKQLNDLAELLVTPERYGKIAVAEVVEEWYGTPLKILVAHTVTHHRT